MTLALVLAAAACVSQARPKVTSGSDVAIPGAEVRLTGSWSQTCTGHSGSMKSGFDYESDCKFVPIRVEVQCSACEVIGPAVQEVNEGYEVRLVTLQPGVLGIRLVMTRLDTGEQHVEERTVDVMKPDWLNFACFIDDKAVGCETTNPDQSKTTAADPRILTAADPRIVPQAGITGKRAASDSSRFMRVNGKPVPAEATLVGFSLANVFPEARVGEGIAPGLYSIELAIADRMQRYTVLAR